MYVCMYVCMYVSDCGLVRSIGNEEGLDRSAKCVIIIFSNKTRFDNFVTTE